MGRPAKALTIARWSVGSNPTLSAASLATAVNGPLRRPAQALTIARWSVGSNPTLSAASLATAVNGPLRRPAQALTIARWSVGSNPTLSAASLATAVNAPLRRPAQALTIARWSVGSNPTLSAASLATAVKRPAATPCSGVDHRKVVRGFKSHPLRWRPGDCLRFEQNGGTCGASWVRRRGNLAVRRRVHRSSRSSCGLVVNGSSTAMLVRRCHFSRRPASS